MYILNGQCCIFENMLEQFKSHIKNNFSILKESKLLIAISGGLDSVVLMHIYVINLV